MASVRERKRSAEADESPDSAEPSDPEAASGSERTSGPDAAAKPRSWRKKALSWALQAMVVLGVLWAVSEWQARRLLDEQTQAPAFSLPTLEGEQVSLQAASGRKVVLYFFAPWCSVCNYSSHNINALREARTESELAIYAVGLGYDEPSEVAGFAKEHELSVPVLLGSEEMRRAYQVDTFPTVYIIDEQGRIEDRVIGYTTELGLRLRSL